MKRFFHSELEDFRSTSILMGEKAINIVCTATRALFQQQEQAALLILRMDDEIDELQKLIDAEAIRYISLRSPVASELRLLSVGMKLGHDLERVGDEATSIARHSDRLTLTITQPKDFLHLEKMAELAIHMLRLSITSFVEGNEATSLEIVATDKKVDKLHKENYEVLCSQMSAFPEKIPTYIELMWISKSLERIADHATNIAEEVLFLLRGEDLRHTDELKEIKNKPN